MRMPPTWDDSHTVLSWSTWNRRNEEHRIPFQHFQDPASCSYAETHSALLFDALPTGVSYSLKPPFPERFS
ncbi:mCG1041984 [Mus musculus]|nr:mCG1041984 [Mus musculus]